MAKQPKNRIYVRERGGTPRYYADFRDYDDVGGGREALKPEGERRATSDPGIAETLASRRLEELKQARRNRVVSGVRRQESLESFGSFHLKRKAKAGVSEKWLVAVEKQLERAVAFFGKERELETIRPSDVRRWIDHLRETPNGRGLRCPECGALGDLEGAGPAASCSGPDCGASWRAGTLSEKTIRDHINSLSNLYRRAQSEEVVPPGYNPVGALLEKPSPSNDHEAEWLEHHEAALLLESARTYEPDADAGGHGFIYPLVATFLLTGGRKSEVLGLKVSDVSFDRKTIRFRPHEHRGLKTKSSDRSVPLWPQLEEILREHVFGGEAPRAGLLFPSPRRKGQMLTNVRKQLDAIGERAGFERGEIRTKMFRHTYTAARLQTLDHGHPVSPYTVSRELGHSSTTMVERVYSHLGEIRHRAEEVEFRVEAHEEELLDRLRSLQAV
jgi:integrase